MSGTEALATAISKNGHSSYLHKTYYVEGSLILNKLANNYINVKSIVIRV